MFEVGKRYDYAVLRGGREREVSHGWLVEEVDGTLIRLSRWGDMRIIKTSSAEFVSATLSANQCGEMLEFVTSDDGAMGFVRAGV